MACPPVPIATTQQLRAQGFSRRDIDHDVQTGVFRRIRPGYFARPEAPVSLVRAIQAGGVATGLTALQHYGVWVPDDPRTHVLVGAHGRGVLDPDVVVHWGSAFLTAPLTGRRFRPVVPIAVALEHALPFLEPHLAVAVGDSALNLGLLGPGMLDRIVEALPRAQRRRIARRFDGRAQSGLESIVRYLLQETGIMPELQVRFDGIGSVDLLIDGWLVLELDGGTHADPASMRRDRARDAAGVLQGLRTLRFGYDAVMFGWPRMLLTIRTALAQGAPVGAAR